MLMLGCHISVTCNNRTSHQASIDSFLDLLIFYIVCSPGGGCMDSPTIGMLRALLSAFVLY